MENTQRYISNVDKYLTGVNQYEREKLFPLAPSDRTRGNGYDLKHMKFLLSTEKLLLKDWSELPREVAESPSLRVFKTQLCIILGTLT